MIRRLVGDGTWTVRFGVLAIPESQRGPDWRDAWALGLRLGPQTIITGPTALRLSGWDVRCSDVLVSCSPPRHVSVEPARLIRDAQARHSRSGPAFQIAARTDALIDSLQYLAPIDSTALFDLSLQRRWIDDEEWDDLISPRLGVGRRGARQLRRLGGRLEKRTRSEAERRVLALVKLDGQRDWICNYPLANSHGRVIAELDFALPSEKLCLEIDGRAFHSDDLAFERDRERQNMLVLGGWMVLRFTWSQVTRTPDRVLSEIRAAIALRSPNAS